MDSMNATLPESRPTSSDGSSRGIPQWSNWLIWAAVVAGVALRLRQFIAAPAMWLDELILVENVIGRSLGQLLTQPLGWNLVAPKGFLAIEKFASLFGHSDYVFRAVPFLMGIAGLLLFVRLARIVLPGYGAVAAVAMFAAAGPLIDYSSRAKQYSSDVAISVLMLLLAVDLQRNGFDAPRVRRAGLIGAIVVWFSQPSILLLAGMAICFLFTQPRGTRAGVVRLSTWWGISAVASAAASLASLTPSTRHYMSTYWVHGFPPASVGEWVRTAWPWTALTGVVGRGSEASLGYLFPWLILAFAVGGAYLIWRERADRAWLFVAPVVVTLLAAIARQYPFSDRLLHFLFPVLFLLVAAAMGWLANRAAALGMPVGLAILAVLLIPALYPVAKLRPPYPIEDIKPVLAKIRGKRQPGDSVFVYYGAVPVLHYYGPAYGLNDGDYSRSGCHKGDTRQYLRELDSLRGKNRAWVVITAAHARYGERNDIVSYLDAIGVRRDAIVVPSQSVGGYAPSAEALLYDFSDTARLASTSADAFALQGPGDPRSCKEGPYSMAPETPYLKN